MHKLENSKPNEPALDLVVLPEFLQGSPHQPGHENYVDLCEENLKKFCAVAKELSICLVPGTISHYVQKENNENGDGGKEEDGEASTDGTKTLLNTSYFISRQGKVKGVYDKKNIWHSERVHYTKGSDPHTTFDTELGKSGMLICWDVMFAEAFKQLAAQEVELIVIPSFWTADDIEIPSSKEKELDTIPNESEAKFLKASITTRAYESGAMIVYTNVGGAPSKGFIGCSQVALPLWGVIPGTRIYDFPEGSTNTEKLSKETLAGNNKESACELSVDELVKTARTTEGPTGGILNTLEDSLDRVLIVEIGKNKHDTLQTRLQLAEDMYKIRQDSKAKDWHY